MIQILLTIIKEQSTDTVLLAHHLGLTRQYLTRLKKLHRISKQKRKPDQLLLAAPIPLKLGYGS